MKWKRIVSKPVWQAHRADFERERDRCDTLMAETLALTKVAMSAREKAARLEGEMSAPRRRRWWDRLIAQRGERSKALLTSASPEPNRAWETAAQRASSTAASLNPL